MLKKFGTLNKSEVNDDIHGVKRVKFETYMADTETNTVGLRVLKDGNQEVDLNVDEFGYGNVVNTAMCILTGLDLPVGTTFEVKISFTVTEGNTEIKE